MTKARYIAAFATIEELESNLQKKVTYAWDSFKVTNVTEEGVEISTEYAHCGGCGTDYTNDTFTWDEVDMTAEDYKVHKVEQLRLAEKEAKRVKAEKAKADEVKRNAAKEEADRKQYEKLKAKYGV